MNINSAPSLKHREIVTTITALTFTGRGMGKVDGKVCFIADVFPADHVKARVTKEKKNFLEAELIEIITPSSHRTQAACPYANVCGGCQWMELDYDQQLHWKKRFIADSISRIGKLELPGDFSLQKSDQLFGYRSRVQLKCQISQEHGLRLGYYQKSSTTLVPITRCLIADDTINEYLKALICYDFRKFAPLNFSLELRRIFLNESGEKKLLLTLTGVKGDTRGIIARLKDHPLIAWCDTAEQAQAAPIFVDEYYRQLPLYTQPLQFTQVNTTQNQILKNDMSAIIEKIAPKSILDLCCGNGNLSLHLGQDQRTIYGIEINQSSIGCARATVSWRKLTSAQYCCQSVAEFLRSPKEHSQKYDLIIVDPPRAGLSDEMALISVLRPANTVIYVSCNPTTLARDLVHLKAQGYTMTHVAGYDFFPHSYHVETLMVFSR